MNTIPIPNDSLCQYCTDKNDCPIRTTQSIAECLLFNPGDACQAFNP